MKLGSFKHLIHVQFIYAHVKLVDKDTVSVVWWSEFLAANPEVPASIPGATRFSE
jgi:hypothetical protein